MRRPMPTAERTMTPGASDQDEQRDDLTEEMRLENCSAGSVARLRLTCALKGKFKRVADRSQVLP
jgi:hypothetical protein